MEMSKANHEENVTPDGAVLALTVLVTVGMVMISFEAWTFLREHLTVLAGEMVTATALWLGAFSPGSGKRQGLALMLLSTGVTLMAIGFGFNI